MLTGSIAGVDVGGPATIVVLDDGIVLAGEDEIVISATALEGIVYRDARLSVFLRHGDVVYADGTPRLAAVAREIAAQVCTLPELTRPLRSLGSRRGRLGAEHDRFFAPLLAARRRGERATDLRARLRAFDAAAITTSLDEAIAAFARDRFPRSAPDRRALEAELIEIAAPLRTALDSLDLYAKRAAETPGADDTAFVRWRSWCGAVQEVFDRADSCWIAYGQVLGDAPPRRRPLWRRVLRLGALLIGGSASMALPGM
jgi:hypothetical protein